jgi:hypothetical protein
LPVRIDRQHIHPKRAPLPSWFQFKYVECGGWKQLIDANSLALERTALATGWHFSYIASTVNSKACGITRDSALHKAFNKVMERVSRSGFNSFEIVGITAQPFLLLYSVRVTARPRHFGPSPFLRPLDPRSYSHGTEDADEIFWRAADGHPQIKGL